MRRILYFLIIITCISGLFYSCTKENYCANDVVAYLKIGFYTWSDGQHVEKTIERFSARGMSSDSLIYNNKSNIKSIELPLSNLSDTSRFIFDFKIEIPPVEPDTLPTMQEYSDTLDIVYTRKMYLVSPLCGFGYNYEIHKAYASHHYIDSVLILNKYVTIVDKENEDDLEILY